MKVNEIALPNFLQKVKSGIQGATQGYNLSKATRQRSQSYSAATQAVINSELQQWNEYVSGLAPAVVANPVSLRNELKKWASKKYPSANTTAGPDINQVDPNNKKSVTQYLTAMITADISGYKKSFLAPTATATTGPEQDISKTLEPGQQYRFAFIEDPTIDVIIRQNGYFLTKLPAALQGQVKRDRATGLYPILRPANILKIQKYYNVAADQGRVKEEPAAAL
jgi:hypothetical protein